MRKGKRREYGNGEGRRGRKELGVKGKKGGREDRRGINGKLMRECGEEEKKRECGIEGGNYGYSERDG